MRNDYTTFHKLIETLYGCSFCDLTPDQADELKIIIEYLYPP